MILNFDATFARTTDVAAVVMTTAPENQRMLLADLSPLVNRRMSLVNPVLVTIANVDTRVARGTANLERVKMKPLKHPKMILNFDATFARTTDVVTAVVMTTAPENQRMLLADLSLLVNQRMSLVNPVLVMIANVDTRVARETANLERVKTKPQKHPKMILNFDATFVKATDVMTTAPENQRMLLADL